MSETMNAPAGPPSVATWAGFALMCVGMFMAILDVQVVATSLPTIQSALGVRPDQISWIQTAYLIAEVIAIPLTGFLTRWLSLRWLFVLGVSVFTLASAGCAAAASFEQLIALRVVQGFSGGVLIPAVFSAVFLLFPMDRQGLATTLAGVVAVLAPTVGPIVGGWVTETWGWRWLFLINIGPGVVVAVGTVLFLVRQPITAGLWRTLDLIALALLATGLSALEIALKDAPERGWGSPLVVGLLALSGVSLAAFVRRSLGGRSPLLELRSLRDRNFAIGCLLSFVLGMGLFGSVYLMPVFLGFVRGHHALRIGEIMLVTGVAQLLTAPLAVALERRMDARVLVGFGFALFGVGLAMSAGQTGDTDFTEMIVPQVVRGVAIMFCLLPPTRMALGRLSEAQIPDASALFNLMRNLGGALGLALIDTVIFSRSAIYGAAIEAQLRAGDVATAVGIGIPRDAFLEQLGQPPDEFTEEMVRPLVEKAALVDAINDAWLLIGLATALALALLLWVKRADPHAHAGD